MVAYTVRHKNTAQAKYFRQQAQVQVPQKAVVWR
jgi:hypothetical protein